MEIIELPRIQSVLNYPAIIERMRDALIANSRGECDTPMPMHLDIAPEQAEVHMKSSYRRGGRYFALKIASTFPRNVSRALPTGNGMMLLSSAETGEPVALLADAGHLTDVRTAAVSAMVAREIGRQDTILGILGTGIQARLQAQMHAEVLDLDQIWIWGRTPDRAQECCRDLAKLLPRIEISIAASPAKLASEARLIVTATASREPLLNARHLQPGTHISAVGSDSTGKQELDEEILQRAALLLADSRRQCEKLGELQHALSEWGRVVEIGEFCESHHEWDKDGITVCDFTGLGVEDLYIAEYCYENRQV
jgi:ornithine cyclodeaminase/alanine dehydrogenase-like protein (mu-crystallin family)